MKEFRKWFLMVLILVLVIGWNVGCKKCPDEIKQVKWTEPLPHFKHQINEFLGKILNRILQGLSDNDNHFFDIRAVFDDSSSWAIIDMPEETIIINRRLILMIENEAEIAFIIAHEIGHIVIPNFVARSSWPSWPLDFKKHRRFNHSSSFLMMRDFYYRLFLHYFEEKFIDRTGIELMSKAGYDIYSSVDIMRRLCMRGWLTKEQLEETLNRINCLNKNMAKHIKENQKKWILFEPEDLEKIKEICRKFGKQNGE